MTISKGVAMFLLGILGLMGTILWTIISTNKINKKKKIEEIVKVDVIEYSDQEVKLELTSVNKTDINKRKIQETVLMDNELFGSRINETEIIHDDLVT